MMITKTPRATVNRWDQVGGRLESFGTSRSAAGGRSEVLAVWNTANRFPSKLAGMFGLDEVMHAKGGSTMSWDDSDEFGHGWCTVLHYVAPRALKPSQGGHGGPGNWSQPNQVVTIADWINDQSRVNGGGINGTLDAAGRTSTHTLNIGRMTMRTIISLACCSRMWQPSHIAAGELVYGGSALPVPVTYDAIRVWPRQGAISGPGGYGSMPNNSTVTFPLPSDYPGSAICPVAALFSGNVATTAGTVTSSGTGVATKTLSLAGGTWADPDRTNPLLMRFTDTDLTAGAKSITLTVTGLAGSNARFQGAWVESDTPPIVLAYATVVDNPTQIFYFPNANASVYATWNLALAGITTEFGPHVKLVFVPTLDGGDTTNAALAPYYTDTMHHTELGTAEYAAYGFAAATGVPVSKTRSWARKVRANKQDIWFSASIGANQTVTNGTNLNLLWTQELENNSAMHDEALFDRVWIVSDGVYHVSAGVRWNSSSALGQRLLYVQIVRRDGTVEGQAGTLAQATGTSAFLPLAQQVTYELSLRRSDRLEVVVFQNSGVSQDVVPGSGTTFTVRKIGEL